MASNSPAGPVEEMRANRRAAAERLKKTSGAPVSAPRMPSSRAPRRPEPVTRLSPAPPDRGLGRWVRVLAGTSEDILDWVPSLRSQYTGLGAIVLITGCLAALAMFITITKVIAVPVVPRLVIAGLWGLAIMVIDRWLMASTHGLTAPRGSEAAQRTGGAGRRRADEERHRADERRRETRHRFAIFAPRIMLAVLLALTISEPVILGVFQGTLNRQVQQDQQAQILSYESRLDVCNPPSGQTPPSNVDCANARLPVTVPPPTALQQQLTQAKQQAAAEQITVSNLQATVNSETTLATEECAGTPGPGLSGIPGDAADCARDWNVANASRAQLNAAQQQLAKDNANVASLQAQLTRATNQYNSDLSMKISQAITAEQNDQRGVIGFIDEWNALSQLAATNPVVNVASWLIRLIFIMLDCLPVLAKLISGSTPYDSLLAKRRRHDEKIFDYQLCLLDHQEAAGREVEMTGKAHWLEERKAAIRQGGAVKMDPALGKRVRAFAAAIPGMSVPQAQQRLMHEALSLDEHPRIAFFGRGRRAIVVGGLPVYEIIRVTRSVTQDHPDLPEDERLRIVVEQTETDLPRVRAAQRYAAAHASEIDAEIAAADAEDQARSV